MLSSELREALVQALIDPERYRSQVNQIYCEDLVASITFTDDDQLLGSKPHNRPLLITGELDDMQMSRIMLDEGSAVNILPLRTLKKIGKTAQDLKPSNTLVQGFNQAGQNSIGTIRLRLKFEDHTSSTILHVIDAWTSYNALLGRPWLHEYKIFTSTLCQCFKYKDESGVQRRVFAAFTTAEAFYADAKFYLTTEDEENHQPQRSLPQVSKARVKKVRVTSKRGKLKYIPRTDRNEAGHSSSIFQ